MQSLSFGMVGIGLFLRYHTALHCSSQDIMGYSCHFRDCDTAHKSHLIPGEISSNGDFLSGTDGFCGRSPPKIFSSFAHHKTAKERIFLTFSAAFPLPGVKNDTLAHINSPEDADQKKIH